MPSRWKKTGEETVHDAGIFKLKRAAFEREDRAKGIHDARKYYYLDSGDWINIVALTREGKVVLIRQFRIGLNDVVLETPGGMVEPEDGSPLEAAKRELLEETGFASEDFELIGTSHPNPAIQNNAIWFFLARDAARRSGQNLDPGEDIEVEAVDLKDVDRLIDSGRITHALVLNAFDFLKRKHPDYWK